MPDKESDSAHEAHLDLSHLERQTMGDASLRHEVLQLFRHQMMAGLKELEESPDLDRKRLAHGLRGAALSIGAFRVAASASLLEDDPQNERHAIQLRSALSATLVEVRRVIGA